MMRFRLFRNFVMDGFHGPFLHLINPYTIMLKIAQDKIALHLSFDNNQSLAPTGSNNHGRELPG